MPRYFRHYKNGQLYELLQIARIEADPDKKAVKERFLTIVSAFFLLVSMVGCHSRKEIHLFSRMPPFRTRCCAFWKGSTVFPTPTAPRRFMSSVSG